MSITAALAHLLEELFDVSGLRNWLRGLAGGDAIVHSLPEPTSRAEAAALAAEKLLSHGMVDATLIASLRKARPGQTQKIDAFVALFPDRLTPPTTPADAPPLIWNIARPREGFVGREKELAALDALSARGGTVALTQALTGLGGVGKTTLARRWAWGRPGAWSLGWWVRAETRALFEDDLLDLGRELGFLGADEAVQDRARLLGRVLQWLEVPRPTPKVPDAGRPWLLVLDNAGAPGAFPVPGGGGVVLVTSRDRAWGPRGACVDVAVFPPEIAGAKLREGLTGAGNGEADAGALAETLGRLPLALAQVNAWCRAHGHSLAKARERLARSDKLLEYAADPSLSTVATTWSMAVEALRAHERALLEVLACFGPDDIPVDLLFEDRLEDASPDLAPLWEDPDALDDALGALHRVCLIERPEGRTSVHRLVQRVTTGRLAPDARAARVRDARSLLRRAMPHPEAPEGWPTWRRLGPHVEGVAGGEEDERSAELLGEYGFFLNTQAGYREARPLRERALAVTERALGPEHPDTARCLGNLAITEWNLGEHAAARARMQRAVEVFTRALGPEHPSTRHFAALLRQLSR